MRGLFFRLLAKERPRSDIIHKHYYFSLGRVGEGYLITVIKQKFEWKFGISFWIVVSMNMFRMPLSADQIIIDFNEPEFHEFPMKMLRQEYRDGLVDSFNKEIKTLEDTTLTDFEKTAIQQQLRKQRDKIVSIWSKFTSRESTLMSTFFQGGFEALCKEEEGVTTYYYMVKRLEDVMILVRVEIVTAGSNTHIMGVQQFVVNKVFAQAFKKAIIREEK